MYVHVKVFISLHFFFSRCAFQKVYFPFLSISFSPFSRYHLKDVIIGKIYFLLVRIKIKYMELQVIKRETTGSGTFTLTGILTHTQCTRHYNHTGSHSIFDRLAFGLVYSVALLLHVSLHISFTFVSAI